MSDRPATAYRGAAGRWARDASLAYAPMARHLIGRSPVALAGSLVLDAGAGTGAASAELQAANACVVAVDREMTMLEFRCSQRPPGVAADVGALPFGTGCFDAVVAAFVLNHVALVPLCLLELARVTRSGGALLASTFSNRRSAAKTSFDEVATSFGWTPPGWYEEIKVRQSGIGEIPLLLAAASNSGLRNAVVTEESLDVELADPALIVRYRLGMPQYAGLVGRLGRSGLDEFVASATRRVAAEGPFRPGVIELVARIT